MSEEFLEAWTQYEDLLTGKARCYFRTDQAEDAVQETFLRVYQKREDLSSDVHLRQYAFLTLRNCYVDSLRRRSRQLYYLTEYRQEVTGVGEAVNNVLIRELKDAVPYLPVKDQKVIQQLCVRDGSVAEESRLSGVPESMIQSRERAAIKRLWKS